jgi:hypothetical protein
VRYKTTIQYPVLTKGNPTTINLILYSIQLPNTSSGTPLLALVPSARLLRMRAAA